MKDFSHQKSLALPLFFFVVPVFTGILPVFCAPVAGAMLPRALLLPRVAVQLPVVLPRVAVLVCGVVVGCHLAPGGVLA